MSSDMWQERRVHEYLSSRPRLYEEGSHLCDPALLKILGARYDPITDVTEFSCKLACRNPFGRETDDQGRNFWISRQNLLLNPDHALKLEHFEESHRSPAEGQRKKAQEPPGPPSRRKQPVRS